VEKESRRGKFGKGLQAQGSIYRKDVSERNAPREASSEVKKTAERTVRKRERERAELVVMLPRQDSDSEDKIIGVTLKLPHLAHTHLNLALTKVLSTLHLGTSPFPPGTVIISREVGYSIRLYTIQHHDGIPTKATPIANGLLMPVCRDKDAKRIEMKVIES
jgi:hypothetical protein